MPRHTVPLRNLVCLLLLPLSLVTSRSLSASHIPGAVNVQSQSNVPSSFDNVLQRRAKSEERPDDWVVLDMPQDSPYPSSPPTSHTTPQTSSQSESKSRRVCAAQKKLGNKFEKAMQQQGYSAQHVQAIQKACCKMGIGFCVMTIGVATMALENAPTGMGLGILAPGIAVGISGAHDLYQAKRLKHYVKKDTSKRRTAEGSTGGPSLEEPLLPILNRRAYKQ